MASRSSKQSSKEKEDYNELFVGVAQFLVAAVPLLLPPDAPLERVLEQEDAADGACRLCDALVDLVIAGHLQALSRDLQLQVPAFTHTLACTALQLARGHRYAWGPPHKDISQQLVAANNLVLTPHAKPARR